MSFLRVRHLSKRYRLSTTDFLALYPVSFVLPSTGLVAIKGKSGSGKSTLLNLLAGIDHPSTGKIYLQGEDITKRKWPLLGHEASMIFQHYNLIEGESVLRNVALPLSMRAEGKKKAKELIEQFGLSSLMDRDVSTLSGGEKQRVAICRALVTDPLILFADEPTGALDEANSEKVMKELKAISSTRLVLLVSHNEELISAYADQVIHIVDGKMKKGPEVAPEPMAKYRTRRTRQGKKWVLPFLLRNLKKNKIKDTMCFLSGTMGFLALLLSFGFFAGNMPAMEKEQGKSLLFLSASISRRSEVEIPGSALTLVKKTRPSYEEAMDALPGLKEDNISSDYSYFLPSTLPFRFEGSEFEPTAMQPIYDITLTEYGSELLIQGEAPRDNDFHHCIVNQEFIDRYGENLLGGMVDIRSRSVVTYRNIQSEVFLDARWEIAGVVKEFGFLNVPRIYYSHSALEEKLGEIFVRGEQAQEISIQSLVRDAEDDSPYGNYAQQIFFHDPSEVYRLFHLLDEGDLGDEVEVTSPSYALRQSFSSLSQAFTSSLTLFVGIALMGLCLILGMASYSSLVAGRKDNAILTVLGAKRGSIISIYVAEALALCLGSALAAFALSPLFQIGLNVLLKKEFDIERLINIPYSYYLGVPLFTILSLLLFAFLLGTISSYLPLKAFHHAPIVEELRDE